MYGRASARDRVRCPSGARKFADYFRRGAQLMEPQNAEVVGGYHHGVGLLFGLPHRRQQKSRQSGWRLSGYLLVDLSDRARPSFRQDGRKAKPKVLGA